MPVPRRFDRQPPERDQTRINERIRVPEVRLVDEDGSQIGVIKTDQALAMAQERDLDLVEVAPDSRPPVARLLDYSKYKYEQEQKAKAARKHQQQVNVREIKLRPKIADHDYETKKGHVERFLNKKDKVKVTIMFRGREQAHPERGRALLQRLFDDLGDQATIEQAADRRARVRRDLDEVELRLAGDAAGLVGVDDADLLAVGADQAHLRNADALVDPGQVPLGGTPIEAAGDRH